MKDKIEYTNLINLTRKEIEAVIDFTNEHKPRALVVESGWAGLVRKKLDKKIKCISVGGYPFRDLDFALDIAVNDVDEFDMVIPINEYYIKNNLIAVSDAVTETKKRLGKKILKVIIETAFIHNREYTITELVKCVEDSGGDVIKTNTGRFHFRFIDKDNKRAKFFDDLIADVIQIKQLTKLPIKAAGGIKTKEQAQQLIDLGVSYIGTSRRYWIDN